MPEPMVDNKLWIRRFHPSPERTVRLVCFPHAGGSASFFFPVSEALSGSIEVLAVQYPGRQDRRAEPGIDDIGALAEEIYLALMPWTDLPLAFFGHSMGAVLAFEVAHRLEDRDGIVLAGLFPSGRRAPSRYRDENIHSGNVNEILDELRLLSGTDATLLGDEQLLHMILPALRSDYKAIETYRCAPGLTIRSPIKVLVGEDDVKTTIDEARDWVRHTTGKFDIRIFPGGHFYLNTHQSAVINTITNYLLNVPNVQAE